VTKAWIPNLISLVRLPLAAWTVVSILEGHFALAFWLLLLSGLTDALDGVAARLLDARSPLGSYLDPIADKVLLVGVFLALGLSGLLPVWLVVLVVGRDVVIVIGAGVLYMAERTIHTISPTFSSKLNTVLQIILAGIVLSIHGFDLHPEPIVTILVWCVAATTVGSGLGYAFKLVRRLRAVYMLSGDDRSDGM